VYGRSIFSIKYVYQVCHYYACTKILSLPRILYVLSRILEASCARILYVLARMRYALPRILYTYPARHGPVDPYALRTTPYPLHASCAPCSFVMPFRDRDTEAQ